MNTLDISASALSAQRVRMTAIAGNIANAGTTRDAEGRPQPYRRLEVLFAEGAPDGAGGEGVHVEGIRPDPHPFQWTYDPAHPDSVRDPKSDRNGYVLMPRISTVQEMVDMMLASRAYEA